MSTRPTATAEMQSDLPDLSDLPVAKGVPPFDAARLDALLGEAGLDAVVVTAKHNVHYLLGGYTFFFFAAKDAIGLGRYLPVLVYVRGRPDLAAYVAHRLEKHENQLGRFWTPVVETSASGTTDAMATAVTHLRHTGLPLRRVGIEAAFLPADARDVLRDGLGDVALVDALYPLERLRACKTPAELALLREASEGVVAAMLDSFAACAPGMTKAEVVEHLRQGEVRRGLNFEYCLITAGSSLNRAPSAQRLAAGDILSLDSGGNRRGYIGDLCRMGILGEPDTQLRDLLAEVDAVQQQARRKVRAGVRGGDVFAAGREAAVRSPHHQYLDFTAHGMGLVAHEAPWLTARGSVPYPGHDETRALEAGMVLSIETTLQHPRRGFVKLEDTVVVTAEGHEGLGDAGRGWNRAGG